MKCRILVYTLDIHSVLFSFPDAAAAVRKCRGGLVTEHVS
jgi:hypothetical protein